MRKLLEHIDLITVGEVTEQCRSLLLHLEKIVQLGNQVGEHNEAEAQTQAHADEAKRREEAEQEERMRQHAAAAEAHGIQKDEEDPLGRTLEEEEWNELAWKRKSFLAKAAEEAALEAQREEEEAAERDRERRRAEDQQEAERVAQLAQEATEAHLQAQKAQAEKEQAARHETKRGARGEAEEKASLSAGDEWTGAMQRKSKSQAVHSELLNIDITRFSGAMLARIVAARAVERGNLSGQQRKSAS